EQVVTVVVGSEQREALARELALVDRETRQLGGNDAPAGDERVPPNERHRCRRAGVPAPGADHLVAQVELPVGVALGGLIGEVEVGGKVARLPSVDRAEEANVAEQLVSA